MLGFPIRTPSDHSSVDSSPRPIAASHVLHRLLMPRHPPCALKHLITTRCSHPLCNTQHTTTPQPTPTTTTPTPSLRGCVRRSGPGAAREQHQRSGVLSGPNSVPNLHIIRIGRYVPPSHTHPRPPTGKPRTVAGVDSSERRPNHLQSGQAASPHGENSLERR